MVDTKDLNAITPERFSAILAGPPEQAITWIRAAARAGVVQAQAVFGQMLLDGRGLAPDAKAAVEWFNRAARKNHPMSMNMLGQCHHHGWGVPVNALLAAYWFRLAAQAGLDWGMYNYGTALALGHGVEMDRAAAFTWFSKAAALGHAKSLNILGGFHEDGWETSADVDAAMALYRRAAEGGDFRGHFNYARLLAAHGQLDTALAHLDRVPETATAAFLDKAADFLLQAAAPRLRDKGRVFKIMSKTR